MLVAIPLDIQKLPELLDLPLPIGIIVGPIGEAMTAAARRTRNIIDLMILLIPLDTSWWPSMIPASPEAVR